jgi:hypothetical protein
VLLTLISGVLAPLGFQSHNADTGGHPLDGPQIGSDPEDNVPKSTIPVVVRDPVCISMSFWYQHIDPKQRKLHQVAKELDAHLPRDIDAIKVRPVRYIVNV